MIMQINAKSGTRWHGREPFEGFFAALAGMKYRDSIPMAPIVYVSGGKLAGTIGKMEGQ